MRCIHLVFSLLGDDITDKAIQANAVWNDDENEVPEGGLSNIIVEPLEKYEE